MNIFHLELIGVRGLWRGAYGQVLRVGMGSAVQISTYERIKVPSLGAYYFCRIYLFQGINIALFPET